MPPPQFLENIVSFVLWEACFQTKYCYSPKIKHFVLSKISGLATPLVGHDGIFISLQEHCSGNNLSNVGLIGLKYFVSGIVFSSWKQPEDCWHYSFQVSASSVKDRQALLNRFNVVYKLTCSCGASYIGQTQRNLINCIEEHRTSLSSAVCRHLQANPDHRVDFHNPEVIGSDNNWRRLQILVSLLIQEHKPELNANIPSMPLCIFNL